MVWVEGEISNFKVYGSGHAYFTLKDANAQMRAVLFRNRVRRIRFEPGDGLHVLAMGSVEVYPQRGEYQLVVELLEPRGLGALQLAFDQLKARLAAEGLFDEGRKRALPRFPRKIGIVTSPSGAAIRDMLRVIGRRFGELHIVLAPVPRAGRRRRRGDRAGHRATSTRSAASTSSSSAAAAARSRISGRSTRRSSPARSSPPRCP